MLLRPRLCILEIGHRKEEGKHCPCRKRLFKCPFLLQSTSWLTVRFIYDYNTFSNFWIKIWSNFADFIKEESFCRQQFFDFAVMYEINEGVFLQVLSATVCMLDVSVLAYPWTMYNQIIWPAWRESLWYSKLIVFFCTYYLYQYSVHRKLNLTVIFYVFIVTICVFYI